MLNRPCLRNFAPNTLLEKTSQCEFEFYGHSICQSLHCSEIYCLHESENPYELIAIIFESLYKFISHDSILLQFSCMPLSSSESRRGRRASRRMVAARQRGRRASQHRGVARRSELRWRRRAAPSRARPGRPAPARPAGRRTSR